MGCNARNWTLSLLVRGAPSRAWPLQEGTTRIGRDALNPIRLTDASVSRQHAEIVCGPEGVWVCDLKSRNGVRVNGVPRQKAALQPGDRLRIGVFELELHAGPPTEEPGVVLPPSQEQQGRPEQTVEEQSIVLPEAERELYTLYHVCFWLTDGIEEKDFVSKCLRLLVNAFRAQEAHLYSPDGCLEAFAAKGVGKPVVKLAAFLAKRFQQSPEAVAILGSSIALHQQRVGHFNYLVGPLHPTQAHPGSPSFLVLIRPVDWPDFTGSDRVLLQAICQLWVRGQARAAQVQNLRRENAVLKEKVGTPVLLGSSPEMEKLRERARKAGETAANVLVLGETGSGKEVVAHLIHQNSPRRSGPFIRVNCSAIPEGLIESELFGHARGAFTGAAANRKGKFSLADKGTLFLDEIGELPQTAQAKVLRAIENREVEPLGSESLVKVDVRIIAATNRDLKEMVRQKQFREDLLYRLDVVRLCVPPLREHLDDLAVLAAHFLERLCREEGRAELSFAPEAIAELRQNAWPGNVRELRNIVQRCAHLAETPVIGRQVVSEAIQGGI